MTTTSIRFLEPDVAIGDGTYEIAGIKDAEGNDMPNIKAYVERIAARPAFKTAIEMQ